jgi:hypothetical protein
MENKGNQLCSSNLNIAEKFKYFYVPVKQHPNILDIKSFCLQFSLFPHLRCGC